MRHKALALAAAAATAAAVGAAVPAAATPTQRGSSPLVSWCARKFDEAQRTDMESYRDFDKATWVAGHDDDAITIYSTGAMVQGRDAIAASQNGHFTNRNAVWSWTEKTRAVDGCSTGTIVYDATYAIPSQNFNLHLIINVTYTFKHGKWLSVIDQGTEIPA
jgi:hypothetical protein